MNAIITAAPNNSLRQRMLQDMKMRSLGAHTQKDYIRHVRCFAAFLGRPPILPRSKTSGGLVVNLAVLWNTIYMDAALDRLRADGHDVRPEDVGCQS